jgi:hypothetical protein
MQNLDDLSRTISNEIHDALRQFENDRPRSKQRTLGPSSLGSCREFLRATIAGDRMEPDTRLPWKSFIGSAIGERVATATESTLGAVTERRVSTVLPVSGITVSGNADIVLGRKRLIDNKSKDGLETIMAEGPSKTYKIQLACYHVGLVQEGAMDEDSTASLVFFDRSGRCEWPYVWSMTYEQSVSWLEVADERLADVQRALATGESQGRLRDEEESFCYQGLNCPFYAACWPGDDFNPPAVITDPALVDAMRRYDLGRDLEKAAKQIKNEAKSDLGGDTETPLFGHTADKQIKWTLYEDRFGTVQTRIDQRWGRGKKPIEPTGEIVEIVKRVASLRSTEHETLTGV